MSATVDKYRLDLAVPHTQYRNAAGKRVPGVTTALGTLAKDLIGWAARVEREGVLGALKASWPPDSVSEFAAMLPEKGYHETIRDTAADIGTVVHARIHAFLRGVELDESNLPAEAVDKSVNGWVRWHDWFTGEQMKCVASELPMVSERWQVGGTLDIVADSPHGLTLCDVKSSKAHPKWPWDEVVAQVAAYRAIWNELNPGQPIARVCSYRCGKEENDPGQVAWFTVGQIAAGEELFVASLSAYRAKQTIGRMRA